MNTPKNSNEFGTNACEDIFAISDETDRACTDTSLDDKNTDETPSDTELALIKKEHMRSSTRLMNQGRKLGNKRPTKKFIFKP